MNRRLLGAVLGALVATSVVGPATAYGDNVIELTCVGTITFEMTPGVSLLKAGPVRLTGKAWTGNAVSPATPCTSGHKGVTHRGGIGRLSGTGRFTCAAAVLGRLGGYASGTARFDWDNGDTSVVDWSLDIAQPPIIALPVKGGRLQGTTLTLIPLALTAFSGDCLTGPATSFTVLGIANWLRLPATARKSKAKPAVSKRRTQTSRPRHR